MLRNTSCWAVESPRRPRPSVRQTALVELEQQVASQDARLDAASRNREHLAEELDRVEDIATEPGADTAGERDETSDTTNTQNETSRSPQTPLERVVGLPEPIADTELTANQERARFIARDVQDYAERVPAGFSITSSALRKVLKAKDGTTPHTQTVTRVIEFLEDLGGDGVDVVKRRGTKRVVFTPEAVERLAEHADRAGGPEVDGGSITSVVMGRS